MSEASGTGHPDRLGRYEIRRILGEGGMGVVYEGYDPLIQRRVAIKAIRTALLGGAAHDPDATGAPSREADQLRSRFQREAQAAGRLAHPRIVTVFEYGEDVRSGAAGQDVRTPYIAMEFVAGRELKSFLDAGERFDLPRVRQIMDQLLEALGHLHAHGVVHRDIKPGNIMVLADGSIKVADFGIARIASSTLTVHGSVMGSPHYMAPEQLLGEPVDGRADLYSAGVVLYELLTAERPFTGGSFTVVTMKALKEQALPPSVLSVTVPKAYDAIIARALAKRPDERFQRADDLRQALRAVTTAAEDSEVTAVRAAAPPVSASSRGRRLVATVVAGLLLVAAATWLLQRRAPPLEGGAAARHGGAAPGPAGASAAASLSGAAGALPGPPGDASAGSQAAPSGVAMVTALGLIPATDQEEPGALVERVRADARQRLVAKAAALYVDPVSLRENYPWLASRLLSRSGDFIRGALTEQPPRRSAAGVMFASVRAQVDVRAVRRLLNQESQKAQLQLTRNTASPRVSVVIRTGEAEAGETSAQRSDVAENIIKERISAYGLVPVDDTSPADFRVEGTAALRRLSVKLPASGLVIEKHVLTSWTIRASDTRSGEQIYFNTRIPQGRSWTSRELALASIGRLVGDGLSRGLFLESFDYAPRQVLLRVDGLPQQAAPSLLPGLQASWLVLDAVAAGSQEGSPLFAVALAGGSRELPGLLQDAVVGPLNQQLRRTCVEVTQVLAARTRLRFNPACNEGLQQLPLEGSWGREGPRHARVSPGVRHAGAAPGV